MKFLTITGFLLAFSFQANAQNYRTLDAQSWPESDKDSAMYTVKGERHGISFFKQHRHEEVIYEAGEYLTFDGYHTVDVMYVWYQKWAEMYPEIVDSVSYTHLRAHET